MGACVCRYDAFHEPFVTGSSEPKRQRVAAGRGLLSSPPGVKPTAKAPADATAPPPPAQEQPPKPNNTTQKPKAEKDAAQEPPKPAAGSQPFAMATDLPSARVYRYTPDVVVVNRAPVLTAWAAIVAHATGHAWETALTIGKVLTSRFAEAKGRNLGVITAHAQMPKVTADTWRWSSRLTTTLMGEEISLRDTPSGVRALGDGGAVLNPETIDAYLARAFKGDLKRVVAAMQELAMCMDQATLLRDAYKLYKLIRPCVPHGVGGWGAQGELDLGYMQSLVKRQAHGDLAQLFRR